MAYKQIKKYGYRDSLEKGDPEKVIYGVDFDAEFEAIENAFDGVPGAGGDAIGPDTPGYEDVVFQTATDPQQVVSEFTFVKAGDSPLTMKNTGMYAGAAYIRYTGATWSVDPSLDVVGGLTVGGDLTVDGTTQLNGDLGVDGNIDATGNISMDGNLAVGGVVDGDLTVEGSITIGSGGSINYPDGTSGIGDAPDDGATYGRKNLGWVSLLDEFDLYDDSWIQPALDGKADVGDSYTKAESDGRYDKYTSWTLQANTTGDAAVNSGTKVNFIGGGDTTVTKSGTTITISSSGGGGGLPDGGYTYGWEITAKDFIANSDERLKEDISPLPVGLINDIKPVQWNWKDGSGKSAGVIAQQLQAIGLDDFVNEGADGALGVNYNALIGVLLAEVISLKGEVESLK